MIIDILFTLFKVVAVLVVILVARAVQLHFQFQSTIKRLSKQGIYSYPGNDKFLIGPGVKFMQAKDEAMKKAIQPTNIKFALNMLGEKDR